MVLARAKNRVGNLLIGLTSFFLFTAHYLEEEFMLHETISKIEAKLRNAPSIKEEQRSELLALLSTLKNEIGSLPSTHNEQAESIAGFAEISAHEATRKEKNPELLKVSVQGLASSVAGFEKSHPELVGIVNRICTTLSNMGI